MAINEIMLEMTSRLRASSSPVRNFQVLRRPNAGQKP